MEECQLLSSPEVVASASRSRTSSADYRTYGVTRQRRTTHSGFASPRMVAESRERRLEVTTKVGPSIHSAVPAE